MRVIRLWIKRMLICAFLAGAACAALYWILLPDRMSKKEIFKGVFLTVEKLKNNPNGSGRIMIVEIHWETPGIQIENRPFSFPVDPDDTVSPHYRLTNADWALLRNGAAILMNTTRYTPDNPTHSIPGNKVRSIETLIVQGKMSHLHQHSYLMFMDGNSEGKILLRKPPDEKSLSEAVWGIGVQGVQVSEGIARYNAMGNLDDLISRSFIGMDLEKKILYLIAYEKADGKLMIDKAIEVGVKFGGQVDSGGGTSMIIGFGANGVLPHTGIKNWRPLGGYLTIDAEKL